MQEPKLPLTPRSKSVLAAAESEARRLDCSYVGTEHLLLGLLVEREGIAAEVLRTLGVADDAKAMIEKVIGSDSYRKRR